MNADELAKIKSEVGQVNLLPWTVDYDPRDNGADQIVDAEGLTVCFMSIATDGDDSGHNAEFIAHAPTYILALVAEVDGQRTLIEQIEHYCENGGSDPRAICRMINKAIL